jgi:hypothetical protein
MSSSITTTPARPAVYGTSRFAEHCRSFLQDWLADFTWADQPLANLVTEVAIRPEHRDLPDDQPPVPEAVEPWIAVHTAASPQRPARSRRKAPNPALAEQVMANPFHQVWTGVLNGYQLAGTWLHPSIRWTLDPYEWATTGGVLPVGTLDRDRPGRPRRFDPDRDPELHDLGVINFPVRAQFRVPELLLDGIPARRHCPYLIGAALAEAGVHEGLEMLQDAPGRPAWDPHDTRYWLTVRVTFGDGVVIHGSAH